MAVGGDVEDGSSRGLAARLGALYRDVDCASLVRQAVSWTGRAVEGRWDEAVVERHTVLSTWQLTRVQELLGVLPDLAGVCP